ncbi:MAG TPA: signal peptidase I [Bacteroidota bacterium]|nr:signal peptidase I [Bacteroidota bacterium]
MRFRDYILIAGASVALALVLKTFIVGVVFIPSPSMETALLPGDYVLVNKLIHGMPPDDGRSRTASFLTLPALRAVRPGDILLFRLPVDPADDPDHPYFVKRCAAVPGDTLLADRQTLFVNGRPVARVTRGSAFVQLARLSEPMPVPHRGETLLLSPENIGRWSGLIRGEGHDISLRNGLVLIDGRPSERYRVDRSYYFVLGDNADHSYDSRAWGLLPENLVEGTVEMVYWSVNRSGISPAGGDGRVRWDRICHVVE